MVSKQVRSLSDELAKLNPQKKRVQNDDFSSKWAWGIRIPEEQEEKENN